MPGGQPESTFLFADIAGYTALTEVHGDEQAADLAAGFCDSVAELLQPGAGELVKSIGDAVMLRLHEASAAVELGLTITREVLVEHGSPAVGVGMDLGPALERDGDWFGATVNRAARVAALAGGGEVLVTAAVYDAAEQSEGVRFENRGEQSLRNIAAPVSVYAAMDERAPGGPRHRDPVCQMILDPGREGATVEHDGETHYFCSDACRSLFVANPSAYAPS